MHLLIVGVVDSSKERVCDDNVRMRTMIKNTRLPVRVT